MIFEPSSEILMQRQRYYRQPLPRRWSDDFRENLYAASSLISWNSSNFCVYGTGPAESCPEIPEGILLNGQTCTNWYHWLINLLPKAFIVEQYLDVDVRVPYLVSKSIQGTRMEEALRLVVGNERKVLFLEDRPHKVARGFLIETPVREIYRPKNILSKFRWSNLGSFHFEIMAQYRSHIIGQCLENKPEGQPEVRQRVFLARDNLSRPANQDEVGNVLEGMGFETLHLDLLPFKEQVSTLNQAKFVISTTGAQWAGWLFSQDAIGLILVPAFLTRSSLFSKLGFIGSSELLELTFKTTTSSWAEFYTSRVPADLPALEVRDFVAKVVQSAGFPRQGQ
ncbi:glycosyltransferase family 61 protein [Pontimonas sp.]|nr:glycosyltransferase family 61 protein [Pontimonas sp.]